MTDSGFSSVASNRSAPATVRPSLLNQVAVVSNCPPTKETGKENVVCTSIHGSLPKPSPLSHLSKSGRSNRFFGPKGNGNYSPSLYSPKEMSPMSCLACDFRDLNTSRDVAETPRKRLSLSSVSSLESFHIRSQPSSAAKSTASAFSSPAIINDDVVGAKLISPVEVERYYGAKMQDDAVVARKKRIELFKPNLPLISLLSRRSSSTAMRHHDSSELSKDVGCMRLSDQAVKGENYFFKPISKGCFTDALSPADLNETEAKFFERAMQDKDANVLTGSCADAKQLRFRRFKSMPFPSTQSNFRSRMWSNKNNGKENSPVFPCGKQSFSKNQGSIDSPSPLHPMVTATSPGSSLRVRRNSSYIVSPKLTSSPLVTNFSSGSSSAFSSVSPPSLKQPSLSRSQSKRQEELRKSAEEVLRDVKSPTNSLTPEKSVVPGSISSLSARTTRLARPASVASFCREKSPPLSRSQNLSPILIRANKRTLDASNTSMAAARKRQKQNSTSELTTTRRRMAFLSKDRKVKSADVAGNQCSPISTFRSGFRPISAPALPLSDDDTPLSKSRLCSSNDSDSDDSDDISMMLEQSQQLADEQLVEEILADNNRARKRDETMAVNEDTIVSAPDGIDGLITAPLLVSASEAQATQNVDGSIVERLPRPRELFRSPSAPPLVTKRRSLMTIQRPTHHCESDTPGGRRSCVCIPEASSNFETDDEPNAILNRSRSFNELDVMKAVELGCSGDNLIGDFSRVCSLETVSGKCQDLKYITPETLMDLIDRKKDAHCFQIIDCRYPYEYDGGHIKGAVSVWEEEALYKEFLQNSRPMWAAESSGSYKPPVLVFYCEFSSERGPRMARALRSKDRSVNSYPHLHYPEIYVLRNGYKNFYHTEGTKEYCHPHSYRPMSHRDFAHELKKCRIKSKSWGSEKGGVFSRLKKRF